jgi:polysaccharide deacetylase 2 family uncharacterized protein YibQ
VADERQNVQDDNGLDTGEIPSGIRPDDLDAPPGEGDDGGDELVGHSTGEDIPDLDSIDWGEGELDGDDDGDDDEDEDGDAKKRVVILIAGVGVVFLAISAAAWFVLVGGGASSDTPAVANAEPSGPKKRVKMAMPPMGATVTAGAPVARGGLNALGGLPSTGGLTPTGVVSSSALGGAGPAIAAASDSKVTKAPSAKAASAKAAGAPAPKAGSLNAIAATAAATPGAGVMVASVIPAVFATLPLIAPTKSLPGKPDPDLSEPSPGGPLPKIGKGGRQPWQYYAKPFEKGDSRPRIAIIVGDMGLSKISTEAAITRLPLAVTLAFDPYAPNAKQWAVMAREAGHEILVKLPVEPETFPVADPGPQALMTTIEPADNLRRLNFTLSRLVGYVGVVTSSGARFNAVEGQVRPILEVLKKRGLLFIDGGAAQQTVVPKLLAEIGLPGGRSNLVLDENPAKTAIDAQLNKLEILARQNGIAIGMASPYPSSLERLVAWAASLKAKNIALAPISAIPGAPKSATTQAKK